MRVFSSIKIFLVFAIFLAFSSESHSQKEIFEAYQFQYKIDSIKKEISYTTDSLKLARLHLDLSGYYINYDSTIIIADKGLKFIDLEDDSVTYCELIFMKGIANYVLDSFAIALEYYDKFMPIYKEAGTAERYAKEQFQHMKMLKTNLKYYRALEVAYEGLDYFSNLKERNIYESFFISGIGGIYNKLHRYDEALKKEFEVLEFYKHFPKESYTSYKSDSYSTISDIYIKKKDILNARVYLDSAIAIVERDSLINWRKDDLYKDKAKLEVREGSFEQAILMLDKLYEVRVKDKNDYLECAYLLEYAKAYTGLNNLSSALHYAEKAKILADKRDFKRYKLNANYTLAKIYELKGNNDLALSAFKKYMEDKRTIDNTAAISGITELDARYRDIKMREEKLELEQANLQAVLALDMQKRKQIYLIIGLLLLGLVLIGIAALLKKKNQLNKALNNQKLIIEENLQQKEILLREIHHRVKNNLQVISSLLNLQSNYISDENALKAIVEGKTRVNSMALIHQKLYEEKNITSINTKEYFEDLLENLVDTYDVHEDAKIELDVDEYLLDVETMIPLGLITNELISNTFKHAFHSNQTNKKISISLKKVNDEIVVKVKDNGKGVDEEAFLNADSFGNKLIQAFMRKLDADLKVRSENGTEVEFSIKKFEIAA